MESVYGLNPLPGVSVGGFAVGPRTKRVINDNKLANLLIVVDH